MHRFVILVLLCSVGAIILAFFLFKPTDREIQMLRNPNVLPEVQRTIRFDGAQVNINFQQCMPDERRIDVGFGSTFIVVLGQQSDHSCLIEYQTEIENFGHGSVPYFTCRIPQSSGTVNFTKSDYGVNFSSVEEYCSK